MSFFEELKRRNVFRVAVAYGVAAWVLLQVADLVLENINAPEWVIQALMLVVGIGFIAAVVIAWAYEMTPEGIRRERDVDRSTSITHQTALKLDRIIIGFLLVAVAYFVWESRFAEEPDRASGPTSDSALTAPVPANDQNKGPYTAVGSQAVSGVSDLAIAVLPFANRSNRDDDLFFTDGIHDDLLTQLAKIRDLKVISRTSVMEYRDTTKKIPEIAAELGVSTILEGGVQRAGNRVRINAQLINVSNDQHLWAETFDRELTMENIFDIQSEITRHIVNAVRGELTEAESQAISDLPTTSVAAYEAYLKARALAYGANWAQENFVRAEPLAELAVELDPEFAEAWALLAVIHGQALWMGYDTSAARVLAMKKAVDKAIGLSPDDAWSLVSQAEYHYRVEKDFASSLQSLKKARQVLPGNTFIIERLSLSQRRLGLFEESVSSALTASAMDPANVSSHRLAIETLANMQEWDRVITLGTELSTRFESTDNATQLAMAFARRDGDLEKARELLDRVTPIAAETYVNAATLLPMLERDFRAAIEVFDQPEIAAMVDIGGWIGWRENQRGLAWLNLGEEAAANNEFRKSIQILSSLDNQAPNSNSPWGYQARATAHARLGDCEKAMKDSLTARSLLPESLDVMDGVSMSSNHALVLGLCGHRDEALAEIERLIDRPWGLVRWEMQLNPVWDFFRDDERFNALIRPHNFIEGSQ